MNLALTRSATGYRLLNTFGAILIGVASSGCTAGANGASAVQTQGVDTYSRQADYAAKQLPYVAALIVADYKLAAQHKITYVQAAEETRAAVRNALGIGLAKSMALELDYAVVVAQQIDSGKITPEMGTFLRQQKSFEIENADRAAAPPTPRALTTCLTAPLGTMVMTNCF